MYYPIQIPYILSRAFAETIRYKEEIIPHFQDFVICLWEMQPVSERKSTVDNIIVADGCIDLVVDYNENQLGYVGMTKTNFDFKINSPSCFYGARFKPGAFYTLTNIPATEVMDNFVPLNKIDKSFSIQSFFNLSFGEAKCFIKNYIGALIKEKKSNKFISLFDKLNNDIPDSVSEIYEMMHYSPKQCQRLFYKYYGISPQMAVCIIRFQKCLNILTYGKANPNEVLDIVNYYDQSHFINDFKKHIGLTPFELVRKYEN